MEKTSEINYLVLNIYEHNIMVYNLKLFKSNNIFDIKPLI